MKKTMEKGQKQHRKRKYDESEVAQISVEAGRDIELEKQKKKPKKKSKDKIIKSLGAVDSELLNTTERNLKVNGLDVGNISPTVENNPDTHAKHKSQRQKKKKSANEKRKTDDGEKLHQNSGNRNERALHYLHTWNSNKNKWKFNKMYQVHLIHMMFDASLVNSEDFHILLLYLSGMKGKAKETTYNQAMKIVNCKNGEGIGEDKEQRAREIVQMLS